MTDSLAKYAVYIDDFSKICVLEPDVVNQSEKLKTDCYGFITKTTDFKQKSDEFISQMDELAKDVEREKMQTIGARNVFRSVAKQRETEKRKIQTLMMEKAMELERLRIEFESLKKIEVEQLETIEHLTVN
ncbi:hypothetical protein HCN44_010840 [Aphidius gifuensis]|uniref:Intraflagellar transport protein 20 n=1 Tax=Aphidius gifuensis TaxID=684658 RepID=A0A834XRX8_APHGI|nr:intraflagellar transport protein 20 homolog [Aphidius gifuensis]XP_044015797.1 intraflagellar transport protein 20 homolog [Aphidius gifuensis]KAF7989258.1 hypothetical protein HCN44_007855 [Aphidius gifuensis]KAF7990174.1 hypothetical protein HCN44_010840 [Aphidius gifuensis]